MGSTVTGTAGAVAPTGTEAMRITVMVAVAMEGTIMTEINTMMSEAGGPGAEAQDGGGDVGVLVGGGIGARLGKAVLKGGPKLSNGIGKESRQNRLTRTIKVIVMMTMGYLRMVVLILTSHNRIKDTITDL